MNGYVDEKRATNRKLIKEAIEHVGLTNQVERNRQTFLLLIHDEKFQSLIKIIRKHFDIPTQQGFRPHTNSLRKWAQVLDQTKWVETLDKILEEFPNLTENFLQHISIYIRFNSIYYAPIISYKTSVTKLGGQKKVTILVFDLLDDQEWEVIKKETRDNFRRIGVDAKQPLTDFDVDLKILTRNPKLITGVVNESGERVKDEVLADRLINKTGELAKEERSINVVRKRRQRIKDEKGNRLGLI